MVPSGPAFHDRTMGIVHVHGPAEAGRYADSRYQAAPWIESTSCRHCAIDLRIRFEQLSAAGDRTERRVARPYRLGAEDAFESGNRHPELGRNAFPPAAARDGCHRS